MTIGPEVQFAQYPDNISDVVELLRTAYRITDDVAYLHRADQMTQMGLRLCFDETSPLPKITNFDDWYEASMKNEPSVQILCQMLELSLDLKSPHWGLITGNEMKGKAVAIKMNTIVLRIGRSAGKNRADGQSARPCVPLTRALPV